ncbi:C4-dicarboxylate ABC transporter [Streptococcus gallolyticus]|nr:C4-dicarboxylate ABC transporter [Streptococcus gallolyticus]MBY5040329.1 C4-dicarboxylate ABC transporter [Streptococcus gallolyticus]
MKKIKKLPFASTGLLLGIVALGNLMKNFNPILSNLLFGLAGLLFFALLIKINKCTDELNNILSKSLPTSSLPTFTMALMLTGTHLPFFWYLGILLHLGFIVHFTRLIWKKAELKDIYPSWYIIYVGLAAGAITVPQVGIPALGWFCWLFGLVSYLILLPSILYRLKTIAIPAENKLNIAILAAPASLLLLGALSLKVSWTIVPLLVLSQTFYFWTIFLLRNVWKTPFVPIWSGMTFPSVSTATALRGSLLYLGISNPLLSSLSALEIIFASTIVMIVAAHYLNFVYNKKD